MQKLFVKAISNFCFVYPSQFRFKFEFYPMNCADIEINENYLENSNICSQIFKATYSDFNFKTRITVNVPIQAADTIQKIMF